MERDPAAIDQGTLDDLEHAIGDDHAFLREVVEAWLEEAPRLIAVIREGIASGDVESTNRAAHTLKSNSATVGALGLSAMARELEAMTLLASTRSEDLSSPEIGALMEVMTIELESAQDELNALVPHEPS